MAEGYKTAYPNSYATIKEYAKKNRLFPTQAEEKLWYALRKYLPEHRFRRQHIIGDYIADFACLRKMLVIEVDGGYHNTCTQQAKDLTKTLNLEHYGYRVLRFANNEVMEDLQHVINEIAKEINNN